METAWVWAGRAKVPWAWTWAAERCGGGERIETLPGFRPSSHDAAVCCGWEAYRQPLVFISCVVLWRNYRKSLCDAAGERLSCMWRKRHCWRGVGMGSCGLQRSRLIPVFCDSKPNAFWAVTVRGSAECEPYTPLFQACCLIWFEGSQVFQRSWLRTTGRVQASFFFSVWNNSLWVPLWPKV